MRIPRAAAGYNTSLRNDVSISQKTEALQAEIAALQTMSHADLKERWDDMFNVSAPHNLSKRLLINALAYHIQVQGYGGLKKAAKQMLADAVAATCQRDRTQSCSATTQSDGSPADPGANLMLPLSARPQEHTIVANCLPQPPIRTSPPLITLSPGTRLMREWRGVVHVVDQTEGGFMWNGKVYRSLSAIARAITGARWNGLTFFGLRQRRTLSSLAETKGKALRW